VDAAYLSNPTPDYPSEARRTHQEGNVLLRVLVAADGHVQDVSMERGCGFPLLDDAAAAAVRKWRFTPGRRGDTAVDAWVFIPIFFKLRA
jgi:protein TonB